MLVVALRHVGSSSPRSLRTSRALWGCATAAPWRPARHVRRPLVDRAGLPAAARPCCPSPRAEPPAPAGSSAFCERAELAEVDPVIVTVALVVLARFWVLARPTRSSPRLPVLRSPQSPLRPGLLRI